MVLTAAEQIMDRKNAEFMHLIFCFCLSYGPQTCDKIVVVTRLIGLSQRKTVIRDPESFVRGCKIIDNCKEEGQWNIK